MDSEKQNSIHSLLINKFNPWWKNVQPKVPIFQRADFDYLWELMQKERSIYILGPRQVGKTTIFSQLIHKLLEATPANRILYADLSDKEILLNSQNPMHDVLQIYQKNVLNEDFSALNETVWLFFDEVQKDETWADTVKSYLLYPKLKITSTGSSSLKLSRKGKETLPGRAAMQIMLPLKFSDFVRIQNTVQPGLPDGNALRAFGKEMRNYFAKSLEGNDFSPLFKFCNDRANYYLPFEPQAQSLLARYLEVGGYPEAAIEKDPARRNRLLLGYSNDVLVKDLTWMGLVRNVGVADRLLYLLAKISACEANKSALTKRIEGANQATIGKYMDFYKEVFLINEIPIYSGAVLGSTKHPKLYFQDTGLRNAIAGLGDGPINDSQAGFLAETISCDHLKRLAFKLNNNSHGNIFCYQSKKIEKDSSEENKAGEVDFIAELPRYHVKLPVECKFRRDTGQLDALYEFKQNQKQQIGLVLTRDKLLLKDGNLFLPLWMFALMC